MTSLQIVFLLTAFVTLLSAVMVVSVKTLFHAALWLVLSFLGVAITFALLEASFFAVVQVLVYIGAIAILIIFSVMLTKKIMEDDRTQTNKAWIIAALLIIVIFAGIIGALASWQDFSVVLTTLPVEGQENIIAMGEQLLSPDGYALPFEVASVLLLAALIGGVYVAMDHETGGSK